MAWVFEPDSATFAVELLSARLVDRHDHVQAGMAALAEFGDSMLFDVAYAWAMGVVVATNPTSPVVATSARVSAPPDAFEYSSTTPTIERGYLAIVVAAANRDRTAARTMWERLNRPEQGTVMTNLLINYQAAIC